MNIQLAGAFRMDAIRPDGSRRVLADWFDNLILDQGLDMIGLRSTVASYAFVGSGSSPPLVTNTAMETQVAVTGNILNPVYGNSTSAPYFGWQRATWRFAAGAAAGDLREVGIGSAPVANSLFSRALIKNSLGNPTTITVLSDEFLDVTYELRLYAPANDFNFQIEIAGIVHDCVRRASRVTEPVYWSPGNEFGIPWSSSFLVCSGPIGNVTEVPSGQSYSATVSYAPYTPGSFKTVFTMSLPLDAANYVGGIQSMLAQTPYAGSYQCSFSPPVMKSNKSVLSLTGEISWARFTPA